MVEPNRKRRRVLKGAAVAALVSVAWSSEAGARETAVDNDRAAEMLRKFYDGYLDGISQAIGTDVRMEAAMIEDGYADPWPLAVWDDVDDARYHGVTLGADGGLQPFWDVYTSFDREFDPESEVGPVAIELLETNDPVPAGETLEVRVALEHDGRAEALADIELVVGHNPTVVDAVLTSVADTETVTLEFETAVVERSQTFPVRVEGDDDAVETTVEVIGTAESR